eukprot:Unigene11900_Nuclearia_a/m.36247 Unigene11900_Nuclearia_a/g.36247  ORF Unigene11900_Nuclearia_a/g.36247 Unigene11900_Nuclearia_a/m.36247 type:complete len:418 (-) Unigene11900_Nuclearia_a:102-1355(-)
MCVSRQFFTIICVNFVQFVLLGSLTLLEFGTAYLLFWWCVFFNFASLFAIVYLAVRNWRERKKSEDYTLDDYLNRRYEVYESSIFTAAERETKVTWWDIGAIGVFYVIWTCFPSLLTMDAAYRFVLGITPQLGRLGFANDALSLGMFWGLFMGFVAVLLLSPWLPLVQRMRQHAWLVMFLIVVGMVAFIVGIVLFPYSNERPRRVDVIFYHEVNSTGQGVTLLTLSAPNPGSLEQVTNGMEVYNTGLWRKCLVPTYGYVYTDGACFIGDIVNITMPTMPSLTVLERTDTSNATVVRLIVSAPAAAASVFKFGGVDVELAEWSLEAPVPPKAQGAYVGEYFVRDSYAIVRRARTDAYALTLTFRSTSGPPVVLYELWSSHYALTPQQRDIIADLPPWTQVWGKSNNPGPIALKQTGSF